MAERVVELERQLGEETKTRELVNKRVSALQGKLSDKESKLLQARRATPNVARLQESLNSVTERAEKLNTENCQMRKALESEAKTNEEQRVYIEVLQAALKARAENLGLDPDQLVNSQQAKFSALAAEATISRLEEAKDKATKETQALNDLLQLESARVKQLQDRLEWYEPSKEHKSPSEEGSKHDNQLFFNDQRQASPRSDSLSVDMLKSQLARLRKENETLVDYVRETVEPLKSKNAELETCLNSTAKVLEETSLRQSTAQEETVLLKDKVEELRLKLVEKDIEVNSAFEARDAQVSEKSELKKEVIALEEKVKAREQELKERGDRVKELEAEVTAMLKQTSEARETVQLLEDTKNALRCERKEIVIVEEKRLQLEGEVRRLEGELATCNAKLERSEAIAQDAERDTQGLRDRLRETKTKLEASMNEQRDVSDDLERAKEELAPLRAFRQRVSQLEKAISDSSTDAEGSRLDGLELVDYVLHALSNIVDMPKEGGPKVDDPMAFNALEVILPNLNSLLCSAKSQVARSLGKQKRLLEELDQAESRFDVEKRLLHDEIHSLRSKLDQYNQSGGSQRDSTELKELREDYAVLEAKYLALEQEADKKDFNGSKVDNTLGNEGQVALLQSDLDKATRLVRDHEHLTKQLEEQLLDVENQLSLVDDETEQVRQLCYQTLKSVSARFGAVNAAVNQYFIGRPFPLPSDTLYQSISTICELLPFVLENDADHTSSTSSQKRLGAQRRGHARAGSMNTSLLRSQRILNETRSNFDGGTKPSSPQYGRGRKESRSRSSSRGRRHRVHAYPRRRAAEDADDEEEIRGQGGESVHVACLQGRSTIRAHSPARVRLYKDGSIQMSTFEKESSTNSDEETNDDDSSSLDAAIRRFDRVDRVRRHAGNRRPGTPLSRRFVQDFQSARDRLRRLNNSSNY